MRSTAFILVSASECWTVTKLKKYESCRPCVSASAAVDAVVETALLCEKRDRDRERQTERHVQKVGVTRPLTSSTPMINSSNAPRESNRSASLHHHPSAPNDTTRERYERERE
jgi:hypothetical protein